MRLKLVQGTKSITCEKSVRPVYIVPRLENQNRGRCYLQNSRSSSRCHQKNTSETPVLQRHAEFVPSVNRTAVKCNTFLAGCCDGNQLRAFDGRGAGNTDGDAGGWLQPARRCSLPWSQSVYH